MSLHAGTEAGSGDSRLNLGLALAASAVLHLLIARWAPADFFAARQNPSSPSPLLAVLRPVQGGTAAAEIHHPRAERRNEPALTAAPSPEPEAAHQAVAASTSSASRFVDVEALDRRPRIIEDHVSSIVLPLQDFPQPGRVILQVWIGPAGLVEAVTVSGRPDLPAPLLEQIIEGFKTSRFLPGLRGGEAVGAVMRVEVEYGPAIE